MSEHGKQMKVLVITGGSTVHRGGQRGSSTMLCHSQYSSNAAPMQLQCSSTANSAPQPMELQCSSTASGAPMQLLCSSNAAPLQSGQGMTYVARAHSLRSCPHPSCHWSIAAASGTGTCGRTYGPIHPPSSRIRPPATFLAALLLTSCLTMVLATSEAASSSQVDFTLPVASDMEADGKLRDSTAGSQCTEHIHTEKSHGAGSYKWLTNLSTREDAQVNVGNRARLRLALDRFQRGGNLTVGFVGGSITAGQGKVDGMPYTAWASSILDTMMGERVRVHNGAVPGTASSFMTSCHSVHLPADADIIFVEYSINDKQQFEMDSYKTMRRMDNVHRRPFERLLRKLLNYRNKPAVVLLHAYRHFPDDPNLLTEHYYNSAEGDFHEFGLYYGLSELSVKAACLPLMLAGVKGFQVHRKRSDGGGMGTDMDKMLKHNVFYADTHHPEGNTGHRIMGEFVVQFILDAMEGIKALPASQEDTFQANMPIPPPMLDGNWEPASERCFLGNNFIKSVASHEGWEWRAEGNMWLPKYGFIADKPGKLLTLKVNSTTGGPDRSQKVMMQLAYLRSYENMGQARITCTSGCECEETVLEGHHNDKNSQLFMHEWIASQADECQVDVVVLESTSSGKHKVKLAGIIVSEESGALNAPQVDSRAVEMVNDVATRDGLMGTAFIVNKTQFARANLG